VSHQHHDHFDPAFLREHVSKETTVLLPDYPLDLLERELRKLGFTKFIHSRNYEPFEVGGLRFIIAASVAPTDGPLGDSGIVIDDGETRIYDQNDSRPVDLDALIGFGPYDAHLLQFSGAIWYPMVYLYPPKMMEALGRKKRENEMARALRYATEINAAYVVPSAGPPCFLDDDLFHLNDFDRDPVNTFPDASVFLEYMQANGRDNGRLMIPGTTIELAAGRCETTHPFPQDEVAAIFSQKRAYLEAYQARQRQTIAAIKASWPRGQVDILAALKEWFEPLIKAADIASVGINGRVLLDCQTIAVVLDFQRREVYEWQGEEWEYRLAVAPELVESEITRHVEDWINDLFLSCRFQAERKGAYNEYVYNFFKCLTIERLEYAEGYYAEKAHENQFFEAAGYRIQRRCPHLRADLTRFGSIENGVLTCALHGWQFELATGRCLTSDDRKLFAQPVSEAAQAEVAAAEAAASEPRTSTGGGSLPASADLRAYRDDSRLIRDRCSHCWYDPKRKL
ncbi:MAG TPA: Rieske 2Fe-2S domain-containing protein, partial [Ktedonobacterales bacterium]|nr:Rieske 2Fe-2S domain-containing protein [Ktedonobacterales bacterium]